MVGICPGGICPGGICPAGICPAGICPDTPQDVSASAKALRILFLLDTLSATWLLCLLNDSEVSRWTKSLGIVLEVAKSH